MLIETVSLKDVRPGDVVIHKRKWKTVKINDIKTIDGGKLSNGQRRISYKVFGKIYVGKTINRRVKG